MRVYILLVSRLVPVLLTLSACLLAGRFLYDAAAKSGRKRAGGLVFTAVVAAGVIASCFFLTRTFFLTRGVSRLLEGDNATADRALRRYVELGGTVDRDLAFDWADALMHERRFREARELLFANAARRDGKIALSRTAVIAIGECFYYEGDLRQAAGAFRVATGTDREYLRRYFLGRIAERQGNAAAARGEYDAALAASDEFFPALHAATRLDLQSGDRDNALRRLERYRTRHPIAARHPMYPALVAAAEGKGPIPPPVEFYVVITA